jgi:hypothetical protein
MKKIMSLQKSFKLKCISSLYDNFNLHYFANMLDENKANKYFKILENELSYITEFGNGRKMMAYGDSKKCNGFIKSWDEKNLVCTVIKNIKHKVQMCTGLKFNYVIINRYADGGHSIGFHSDRELPYDASIAGVSLGACRKMRLRSMNFFPKYLPKQIDINLDNGSLYVLHTPTNNHWQHSIPKVSTTKVRNPRISLTFRYN